MGTDKKEIRNSSDYYIGLDMGTSSVGWAVTNTNYKVSKFHKKSMWGVRLFEAGETAESRRGFRTNRRRLKRRRERLDTLNSLFHEEIVKVDETFLQRLNESRLQLDDKTIKSKYSLFPTKDEVKEYYKKYPTIFHLRKELMSSKEPHDIRLVYLAIHHIMKYRGHFLFEGELSADGNFNDLVDLLNQNMSTVFTEIDSYIPVNKVECLRDIITSNESTRDKINKLNEELAVYDKDLNKKLKLAKFVNRR